MADHQIHSFWKDTPAGFYEFPHCPKAPITLNVKDNSQLNIQK